MIISVVMLALILLMIGFGVYIVGVISAKIDLIAVYVRQITDRTERVEEDKVKKQFFNMMNYSADERRDEDD